MLIHDFSNRSIISSVGTPWRAVSDRVMGGVSEPAISLCMIDGRACLRLTGDVRLENGGGFIQAALDLAPRASSLNAAGYHGVRLVVRGNGERYSAQLRTLNNLRPWQSYQAHFPATSDWETINISFSAFTPHRIEAPLHVTRLRRFGLVAIGRTFCADLAVARIEFYD